MSAAWTETSMHCNSSYGCSDGTLPAVAEADSPAQQDEQARLERQSLKISRALLVVSLLLCAVLSHAQGSHDVAFWRSIAKNKYAVPANESADALAHEVSGLLALSDPELRDDLAYSILARWIHRGYISNATAVQLTDEWRPNLKNGIGENGTNS